MSFRVLVVDDEPQVRALTSRALERINFACDTAADGDEALQLFNQQPYDAVLTDIRMPRRHGHSLAVELLSRPAPPRVVVVTGLAAPDLVRDLVSRGVTDVMTKPVNYDVLTTKMAALASGAGGQAAAPAIPQPPPAGDNSFQLKQKIERSLVELSDIFSDTLAGVFDFEDELPDPPTSVGDFITRFNVLEEEEHDRPNAVRRARRAERIRCNATAIAVPVTRRFAPEGDPFKLAVRDVSDSGIRLLHTRATSSDFLALSWTAETLPAQELRIVAKVMRCRPLSPFYDIGGEFVLAD